MERVTIRDVAKKAGVSTATVSRALRGDACQSAETKKRIQALAKAMGYRPDPLIAALVGRRWRAGESGVSTIAWLTDYPEREGWRNREHYGPFVSDVFEGASARARETGYRLEHFWLREPGMNDARMADIIHNRGIRGLLVAPLSGERGVIDMPWERFSCATVGYSLSSPNLYRVCPHHFTGMRLALEKLHGAGYRRIGVCLNERLDAKVDYNWQASTGLFQSQHADCTVSLHIGSWAAETLLEWVDSNRLEVVLAGGNSVVAMLKKRRPGVVPASLSWAPGLGCAGLDQRAAAAGAAAVDMIVGQIQRHQTGAPEDPSVLMVEGRWREADAV